MAHNQDKSFKRLVPLLVIMVAVAVFASDAYLPFLPEMTQEFGTTAHVLQVSVGLFIVGVGIGQIFIGPLSDKVGRRPVVLTGIGCLVLSTAMAAFATNIHTFLIARLLQGLSATCSSAITRSTMRDLFSGAKLAKAISIFSLSNSMTPVFAPVIGAYIGHHFGWRYIFYFLIVVYAIVLAALYWLLPETNTNKQKDDNLLHFMLVNYKSLLKSRKFVGYSIIVACTFAALYGYLSCSAFIFQEQLGLSPIHFAWLTFVIVGGSLVGRLTNFGVINKIKGKRLIKFALIMQFCAALLFLTPILCGYIHVWSIICSIALWVSMNALIMPNMLVEVLSDFPHIAGSAASLYGTFQMLGGAVGSLVIAMFAHQQPYAIAIMYLILAIISGTTFYLTQIRSNKPSDELALS